MIKGNADDRAEVTELAALFRVAGEVHFALRRTVANEARRYIVFGNHDAKSWMSIGVDDAGVGLPLGPLGTEQFGLDDVGLPSIGPSLAVAHQLGRCGDLHLGLPFGHLIEILADETGEDGRDEALEPGPFLV